MSGTDELLERHRSAPPAGSTAPSEPASRVAVVTCMDARVDPARILGLEVGDAHVIRNAGGIVTDDVLRSLAASQHFLGTREVVLVQHTDCGMQAPSEEQALAAVEAATGAAPLALGTFADLEESLRTSAASVRDAPYLVADSVRAFVYDVATGSLREIAV